MTANCNDIKHIDLAKIIQEGNSKILKKLPHIAVRLVAKIIKQDEINCILNKYSEYTGAEFLPKIIEEFNLKLEIEGKENLPENGKCFFVANHPFGIIDGLILTLIVSQKYGTLKAIANDSFMFVPQLRPFIAAVNVFGKSSKEYLNAIDGQSKGSVLEKKFYFESSFQQERYNSIPFSWKEFQPLLCDISLQEVVWYKDGY